MNFFKCTLSIFSLFIIFSCSEKSYDLMDLHHCEKLNETTILSAEELSTTCVSEAVYTFRGKIYFVCECCICFKKAMPISCEGDLPYDSFNDEDLDIFYLEAEYHFNVVLK
ncbi:MAG: hypothetical protein AAGA77_13485 [Bacteroidota bacterium]